MLRSLRGDRLLALVLVAMVGMGAAAWLYGLTVPEWTDSSRAELLYTDWCGSDPDNQAPMPGVYEARNALRTMRWWFVDGGQGLILAAATFAVLRFGAVRAGRFVTPARPFFFLVLGGLSTIGFFAAAWRSILVDFHRLEFPSCADSIGIGLIGVVMSAVVVLPVPLLAGVAIMHGFGRLPASIWIWDARRRRRSWFWSIVCGLAAILLAVAGASALFSSMNLALPSCIIGIYLLAATRAALLSPPADTE